MANRQGFYTMVKRETLRFITLPNQTVLPAIVNAGLYIVVFGFVLGSRIQEIEATSYIIFIFPGLVMMSAALSAFQNSATSLFHSRWENFIQDLLVAPISFPSMVWAYVISSAIRGMLTGLGVLIAGLLLLQPPILHPIFLFLSLLTISTAFGAFGLLIGLWAQRWDNLAVFINYVITPLVFLGGVFYATSTLPEGYRWVNHINPLWYMVEGVRFSFLDISDISIATSLAVSFAFGAFFFLWGLELFRRGYNLRV